MNMKTVFIASDHGGYCLKQSLLSWLSAKGYSMNDLGCTNAHSTVDYPDYALMAVKEICTFGDNCIGILICKSGIGMSIVANRYKHIRAALCLNAQMSELARRHNNANVLCLGQCLTDTDTAYKITEQFLNTEFAGSRHTKRIEKFNDLGTIT